MTWDAIDDLETDIHSIHLSDQGAPGAEQRYTRLRRHVLEKMLQAMRAEQQKLLDTRRLSETRRGYGRDYKNVTRSAARTIQREFPLFAKSLLRELGE